MGNQTGKDGHGATGRVAASRRFEDMEMSSVLGFTVISFLESHVCLWKFPLCEFTEGGTDVKLLKKEKKKKRLQTSNDHSSQARSLF